MPGWCFGARAALWQDVLGARAVFRGSGSAASIGPGACSAGHSPQEGATGAAGGASGMRDVE